MSQKVNRLRRRLQIESSRLKDTTELDAARKEIDSLKRQLRDAAVREKEREEFEGFRVAVKSMMPFQRGYSDILACTVSIDPRAIEYGFIRASRRDQMESLSRHIFYVSEEVKHKVCRSLMDHFTKSGVADSFR